MNLLLPPSLARSESNSTIRSYLNVLYALIMHDIKTRFFGNGLGQIVMILWPFVHVVLLLAIYYLTGRAVPYGQSAVLYSVTGVFPFIIFAYMSRWIVYAAFQNKVYCNYPVVRNLDIMIARGVLETVNTGILLVLVVVVLALMGVDFQPASTLQAAYAIMVSVLLSFGVGLLNGAIAAIAPMWITAYSLSIILFYAGSGILFVAGHLPENARYLLSFNPVLQLVEWMRSAYYPDYPQNVLDRSYTLCFALISLAAGLLLERLLRPFVRN